LCSGSSAAVGEKSQRTDQKSEKRQKRILVGKTVFLLTLSLEQHERLAAYKDVFLGVRKIAENFTVLCKMVPLF